MKPTTEQIKEEIKRLKELKPKVRPLTGFGDSNTDAIQAQIDVLERGMDEDEIYDRWNLGERDAYQRNSALTALAWMETGEMEDMEEGETPAVNWNSLVRE